MNIWGERFCEVGDFIRYCRDLNIQTDERELEHYEKIGVMLPAARMVYPDDYVVQSAQKRWDGCLDWDEFGQWPELGRLVERMGPPPYGYRDLSDIQLVHCFDREMDAGNKHISNGGGYRPWSDYTLMVASKWGHDIRQPTAEHYYSYWQVHQLHRIQKYPDLYLNFRLIEGIPADDPVREWLPRSPNTRLLLEFDGKRSFFDALSFWITVTYRERGRTFAQVTETNGISRLTDDEAREYQDRLVALSKMVKERFQITSGDLYEFLRRLIGLLECYRRNERYMLAGKVERYISHGRISSDLSLELPGIR